MTGERIHAAYVVIVRTVFVTEAEIEKVSLSDDTVGKCISDI
jgi:hypothetical protein